MDQHVSDYFFERSPGRSGGNFEVVIALHEKEGPGWAELHERVPSMPRGWFELAGLTPEDRIEFTQQHWLDTLPYSGTGHEILIRFFERLDDIGIFVTKERLDKPFEAQLVYSLRDNEGFYHGYTPVSEERIYEVQSRLPELLLPVDYKAFLRIHNGFSKCQDTGLTRWGEMGSHFDLLQAHLALLPPLTTSKGIEVNPRSLIPFYESFGLHCYQCFWSEWYPAQEMGNVYYSGIEHTLIDPEASESAAETMAFPTFVDWLAFYVDKIG